MADERIPAESARPSQQAVEAIPFELRAINAEQVGALLGMQPRTVLETVACRPDFPVRLTMRPATWIAGEVLAWRDLNRAGERNRRRADEPSQRQKRCTTQSVERRTAQDAAAEFCKSPVRRSD